MNYINLALVVLAVGYGLTTSIMRFIGKTESLPKLEKMKQTHGEKRGNLMHLIAYSIIPLAVGIVYLFPVIIKFL